MSGELPSVVGLELKQAQRVMEEAGVEIQRVATTGPPGAAGELLNGGLRVVQQRQIAGNKISVVVAREMSLETGN